MSVSLQLPEATPPFRTSPSGIARYGIDPQVVVIGDNHPDLIGVHDDGNGRHLLRVMDVKRGEALHLTHRVQVLLYALELEAILWAQSIDGVRVDIQQGEVWLGSQTAPSEFDLTELRPHLESFLQSIRHRGADAIYAWAAKFALPTRQPYADPLC